PPAGAFGRVRLAPCAGPAERSAPRLVGAQFATGPGWHDDLSVSVRAARVEDAERIAEIHVLGWQGRYQGLMPQGYLGALDPVPRLPGRVQSLIGGDWSRGGCFVVAGDDGQLAGFAAVGATRDDDDTGEVGEVRAIYLVPGAWGQGLGRALMAAA